MSNSNAAKPKTTSSRPLLPPPETFWKRYSPRHEFPLSYGFSFFLHAVVVGLILLIAYLAQLRLHDKENQPPTNDVVMAGPGGDGLPTGGGSEAGDSKAPLTVEVNSAELGKLYDQAFVPPSTDSAAPELNPKALELKVDESGDDVVYKTLVDASKDPPKLAATMPVRPGIVGSKEKGIGGLKEGKEGSGGGKEKGREKGFGDGYGKGGTPGGRAKTLQEFLAQRWNFDLSGPPKMHLDKLAKVGFIVGLETPEGSFFTISNINARPIEKRLDNRDKYKDAVTWYNRHGPSVQGVAKEMGLTFPVKGIVLILPRDREKKLVEEEIRYAKSIRKDLKDFDYIWFDFRLKGETYEPVGMRVGKGPVVGPG